MTNHRVTCEHPDCGRIWREGCADCAQDTADRHRRETGHPVTLQITQAATWEDLKAMTGMAHPRLLRLRRTDNA